MIYRQRQQLAKLFQPDYRQYPCCRPERCHYNHRLDYPLLVGYAIALYHFLRDWMQAPYQLEMSSFELLAWLVVYLWVIAMQVIMFRKFILPLVIGPATFLHRTCYSMVMREVISPAKSFLSYCYLTVAEKVIPPAKSFFKNLPPCGREGGPSSK